MLLFMVIGTPPWGVMPSLAVIAFRPLASHRYAGGTVFFGECVCIQLHHSSPLGGSALQYTRFHLPFPSNFGNLITLDKISSSYSKWHIAWNSSSLDIFSCNILANLLNVHPLYSIALRSVFSFSLIYRPPSSPICQAGIRHTKIE